MTSWWIEGEGAWFWNTTLLRWIQMVQMPKENKVCHGTEKRLALFTVLQLTSNQICKTWEKKVDVRLWGLRLCQTCDATGQSRRRCKIDSGYWWQIGHNGLICKPLLARHSQVAILLCKHIQMNVWIFGKRFNFQIHLPLKGGTKSAWVVASLYALARLNSPLEVVAHMSLSFSFDTQEWGMAFISI